MRLSLVALTVACLSPIVVQAQVTQPRPPKAVPGAIVGLVTDTVDAPLDSVELFITAKRRRTTTHADGTFMFDDVKPGAYDVSARRLGFLPQIRSIQVTDSGAVVAFALVPFVRALPPVVSSSTRGGLSGVVGDTAYNIVVGAQVTVVGSGESAVTDSTGSFFFDLKAGRYMVRVKRDGFASRLVSVTVPKDSGRRITVWLPPGRTTVREEIAIVSLRERLVRRSPVWSKIYTREDLMRLDAPELRQIATMGAGRRVDDNCMAVVDGGPYALPVWMLDADDIETVEIYTDRPARRTITSINNNPRIATQRSPSSIVNCPATIYVWLRK